jgi:type III restriction enzyme
MGNHLYQVLAEKVEEWASVDYPSDFSAISEIMDWAQDSETGTLRFLRRPQLQALKTYWYLRLIENTPSILDLYSRLYSSKPKLLDAIGLNQQGIKDFLLERDGDLEALWERVRSDDDFVRDYKFTN